MWELTKTFHFEAAHSLTRDIEAQSSRRIHGHSYRAVVAVRGAPDPSTGMVIDLGVLDAILALIRADLDHHLLDEVAQLGAPTLENLAIWVWQRLAPLVAGLARVSIHRDSLADGCSYFGPSASGTAP